MDSEKPRFFDEYEPIWLTDEEFNAVIDKINNIGCQSFKLTKEEIERLSNERSQNDG